MTTDAEHSLDRIPDDRRLVVIQRNPTSGSGKGSRDLRTLISDLREGDFQVRLFANRDRLDRFLAQPRITDTIRCLVAAGGDGTIGSLLNRHADYPIATLPMGTENLVARYLKIRRCGATLARLIGDGWIRRFDTGTINDQTFLLMASVGVDAAVVQRLDATRNGHIQHLSYVRPIFLSLLKYGYPRLQVFDRENQLRGEGSHVIATNIPEYGFRMPFAPEANPFDGLLDVRIFRRSGFLATAMHAVRTRLGWKDRDTEVARFRASEIRVQSSASGAPSQCDGDPANGCPVQISLRPRSMTLVVSN